MFLSPMLGSNVCVRNAGGAVWYGQRDLISCPRRSRAAARAEDVKFAYSQAGDEKSIPIEPIASCVGRKKFKELIRFL